MKMGSALIRTGSAIALATAALGAGTLIAAPVAAQEAAKVAERKPISEIGTIPNTQQVRISPEGNRLAMTVSNDGQEVYAVLDLDDPNPRPRIFASSGEFTDAGDRTVGFYRWIGNDHVVFQLVSRDNIQGQRADQARLVSFNVNTGKMEPLVWRDSGGDASRILHVDHKTGKFLLQRSNLSYEQQTLKFRPEVVEVDVATGKYSRVQRPNVIVGGWFADGNGVIRMGTAYDGDSGEQRLLYRSGDSGNFRTVQKTVDENFTGAGLQPEVFLDEPDMAIVTSNHEGFSRVYKANLVTQEIVEELFRVEGYDAGSVIRNREGNEMVGVTFTDDRSRVKYFDPMMNTIKEDILDDSFGKDNARMTSSSEDRTKLVLYVGKTNQAGGYYYYDTVTGDFKQIGWSNNALKDTEMNPVSMVRYQASDGETIEAAVTMPRHRAGQKNLPVVMITHGGPFGPRDDASYEGWAQSIAEQGYVVVQPNYRGSGGYGSEWIKKGRDDGFGLRMQDDLNDAIDHLANEGIVDGNRACMMGWSYGGYASARAAQRDPDRWNCTIAGAGVYDLGLMRRFDVGYLGKFGSNYLAKGAGDLDDVSPAKNGDGKWSPILIVHGVRDARVPVEQARVLVSELKNNGKVEGTDFIYLEQEKNTHNLPYDYTRIEWLGGAAAWLEKHNPAYVAGDPDFAKKPALDPSAIKMAKELNISL